MMRAWLTMALVLAWTAAAFGEEPGTLSRIPKTGGHILLNPVSDTAEGGEDFSEALPIERLPFEGSGATCDNLDDFHVDCPYPGAGSPDVVYSLLAAASGTLAVDLCGSGFDTKLLVFDQDGEMVACNDDAYYDDACGRYTSLIPALEVVAGRTYFLVVDGYGGDCGSYLLGVSESDAPPTCSLDCVGMDEGEPPLSDGYLDMHNGGCNSAGLGYPFQDLVGDGQGEHLLCGASGWYDGSTRDTDWFIGIFGSEGQIRWTLDAEQRVQGRILAPLDCGSSATVQEFTAGPCLPASLTVPGEPGGLVWIWIAPLDFVPPAGFTGHEFAYTCRFEGLQAYPVAAEEATWDRVKSLYR